MKIRFQLMLISLVLGMPHRNCVESCRELPKVEVIRTLASTIALPSLCCLHSNCVEMLLFIEQLERCLPK